MKYIIDRIVGDTAVLEASNKQMITIPAILVSEGKEGDVVRIEIDHDETNAKREKINTLMQSVWEDVE